MSQRTKALHPQTLPYTYLIVTGRIKKITDMCSIRDSCIITFICMVVIYIVVSFKVGDHIGGVIVNVVASSAEGRGLEVRSGQIKDYKIGISCFYAKYGALRI